MTHDEQAPLHAYYELGEERDRLDRGAGALEFARTKEIVTRHLPAAPCAVADIGGGPFTECLKDVVERFAPYYTGTIEPDLRAGKTVLIAAHGNSLRALVKYLDGMSDEDVVALTIPTGIPLRYDLDGELKPTVIGGTYLDPEAAAAGAAAVAAQGAK